MLMPNTRHTCLLLALLLMMLPMAAAEASPRERLQERYGEELRDPATQLDPRDLADQMLRDAKRRLQTDDDEYGRLLLEEIYQLAGNRPSAYDIALEANTLMAEHAPWRRNQAMSRSASILQRMLSNPRVENEAELNLQLTELLLAIAENHEEDGSLQAAKAFYTQAKRQAENVRGFSVAPIDAGLRRVSTAERIASLKQRLAADRTDAEAAEQLMRLHLMEQDNPEAAYRLRFSVNDEELKRMAALANQSPEHLMPEENLELGAFYLSLSDDASPEAERKMLAKAHLYYQQYVDGDPADAGKARQARLALRRLANQMDDLGIDAMEAEQPEAVATTPNGQPADPDGESGPISRLQAAIGGLLNSAQNGEASAPQPDPEGVEPAEEMVEERPTSLAGAADRDNADEDGGDWVDLLAGLDTKKHGVRGVWSLDENAVRGAQPTPAQLILPIVPDGDYVFETSFTRTSGTGAIALHLPLSRNYHVMVKLGERRRRQRDHVAGFEMLDNQPAFDNESTVVFDLETDRRYDVRIEVVTEGIEVDIKMMVDDETLIEWHGFRAALSIAPIWESMETRAFGLGLDGGAAATFHHARLKMVFGSHEPLE